MFAHSSPSRVVMLRSVITPSFDKYSHDENILSGFSTALLRMCARFTSRSGNKMGSDVYCLRARDLVASAAPWSSDVASVSGPGDHRCPASSAQLFSERFAKWSPPSGPWQKRGQNHSVDGLVVQSEVLQFKDRGCPQRLGQVAPVMQPYLDTAAGLGWIKNLLPFIDVFTFRNEWNHVGPPKTSIHVSMRRVCMLSTMKSSCTCVGSL